MPRAATRLILLLTAVAAEAWGQDAVPLRLTGEQTVGLLARSDRLADSAYGFAEKYAVVRELGPAAKQSSHPLEAFRAFLPAAAVRIGDVWAVDPEAAIPFLRQIHPGATDRLHHGRVGNVEVPGAAPGSWACLRAAGPRWAEVFLRIHADFLIAGDGTRPSSWLTPAQFQGRLVVDRRDGTVADFELALPDQSANVDINVDEEDGTTAADIGRVPRMEVRTVPPPDVSFTYAEEIAPEAARRALERRFYPAFGSLDWLPLKEALAAAKATGRPLHVIALFGSLMDESC